MIKVSKSPEETQKIAGELALKIIKGSPSTSSGQAQVLGLEGELGAGKTVFVKGFAKVLKIKGPINSPTFIIMKKYKIPQTKNYKLKTVNYLYHVDVYRLKNEKDLIKLGIKQVFESPSNIVLIEWSDRVKKILPKNHTKIHIDHLSENKRKITIK